MPLEKYDCTMNYPTLVTFGVQTSEITKPSEAVNRHGILHGDFSIFENEGLSLKYLALFDALAFLMLHDRTVSGSI